MYNEWLKKLLGMNVWNQYLANYGGYNPTVNPVISSEFSIASFRVGHALLTEHYTLRDSDDNVLETLQMSDIFFNPSLLQFPERVDFALVGATN